MNDKQLGLCVLMVFCSWAVPSFLFAETCTPVTSEPGIHHFNGIIQGIYNRSYRVYIPPNVANQTAEPSAVVFDFHGTGSNKALEYENSCWADKADTVNAIVIYPYGIGSSFNAGVGCCSLAYLLGINDVWYSDQVLQRTKEDFCIGDETPVYASGWSNGGKMAARLACELNSEISGVASFSQSYALGKNDVCYQTENGETPLPVIEFRGFNDIIAPYNSDTFYSHAAANSMLRWGAALGMTLTVQEDANGIKWAQPGYNYVASKADPGVCRTFEGGTAKLVQCSYEDGHNLFDVQDQIGIKHSVCDTAWEFLQTYAP